MQIHDDMLINFYISQDQEEAARSYRYLEDLVKKNVLPHIDYNEFMGDLGASALKSYWQYIQTPPLTHYTPDQGEDVTRPISIHYLPIPSEPAFRATQSQESLSLTHSILHKVIMLAAEYILAGSPAMNASLYNRLGAAAQKYLSQLILLFQQKAPPNRWILEVLTESESQFELYEEILPPLQAARPNISSTTALEESAIREVRMVDDNNILFDFENHMMHYVLSTDERLMFKTPQLTFSGLYEDKCLFYCDSGFANYEWKNKRWNYELLPDSDYIILSPEHDLDIIFNLRKKRVLTILEPMDRGEIKVINTPGTRVLIIDKESHGGIYNLQTGLLEVDARQINWFPENDEIVLEPADNQEPGSDNSKATAIWAADGNYKIVAFGRLIVDGAPVCLFREEVLSACFTPTGDHLILCRQNDWLIYDINRRSTSHIMAYEPKDSNSRP
jgi:hypothetical protein